ncbi:MAG: VWA domain-containing protein [Pseudomonadota bacterium]
MNAPSLPEPAESGQGGALAENVVYFARALRAAGLKIGPRDALDAVKALTAAGIGDRDDFYWVLHAVFVQRREDHEIFDQAFRLFWRKRQLLEKMMQMLMPVAPANDQSKAPKMSKRVSDALLPEQTKPPEAARPKPELELDMRATTSDQEILQGKDFADMSAAEIAEAKRRIADLVLPDDRILTRRYRPSVRGRLIDMRRTLRGSLRGAGGIIDLERRARRRVHPPIVALVDISGSMSDYTQILLHFLHALTEQRGRVSSFVFGTRLTNITRALRRRDPEDALEVCGADVRDWAGGTRIGESLHAFNRQWSRRVLGQGAVVLLFTDGLERDEIDMLDFEIDRLHRSCRRLIWLNPLLRFDGFAAKAQGIRTMLKHVDDFRPVHNLSSMGDLCAALDVSQSRTSVRDPKRWLDAA